MIGAWWVSGLSIYSSAPSSSCALGRLYYAVELVRAGGARSTRVAGRHLRRVGDHATVGSAGQRVAALEHRQRRHRVQLADGDAEAAAPPVERLAHLERQPLVVAVELGARAVEQALGGCAAAGARARRARRDRGRSRARGCSAGQRGASSSPSARRRRASSRARAPGRRARARRRAQARLGDHAPPVAHEPLGALARAGAPARRSCGTTSSAAPDGVGARTSATKSAMVKSTSCPTALTTGTRAARRWRAPAPRR